MELLNLKDVVADDEIFEIFKSLIVIDSSAPSGNEEPVAELLAGIFGKTGFQITVDTFAPNRANTVARKKGSGNKPALLLSGHLDTVPASSSGWDFPPFSATVKDGVLYGRGAVDMKGAVAAMTAACLAVDRAKLSLKGNLLFAGTAGEEVDSAGARRLIAQGIEPVGEIIVGEPTRLMPASAHKGALWLEIECQGTAAHGSMPQEGENAIWAMCDILRSVATFRSEGPAHPTLGAPTLNLGIIQGGSRPNIVPDRCLVTLDLRTLPGESHESIVHDLRRLCDKAEVRVINDMPAVLTSATAPLVQTAQELLNTSSVRGMTYYSDASILTTALGAPTLICGPGDERLAHQANEHIELAAVFAAADFYFKLIQRRLAC